MGFLSWLGDMFDGDDKPKPKPKAPSSSGSSSHAGAAPASSGYGRSQGSSSSSGSSSSGSSHYSGRAGAAPAKPKPPTADERARLVDMLTGAKPVTNRNDAGKVAAEKKRVAEEMANAPRLDIGLRDEAGNVLKVPEWSPLAKASQYLEQREGDRKTLGLGGGKDFKPSKDTEVKQLTWDEYNKLTPAQRGAIDFNTMLVQASRKDRKANARDEYKPTAEQQKTYDVAVKDMFGPDGGSDLYAPETLAMLQQIKYKDQRGDLDDFLSLKTAITAEDLQGIAQNVHMGDILGPKEAGPHRETTVEAGAPDADRLKMQSNLIHNTQQLQIELAKSNQLLSDWRTTSIAARGEGLSVFGGQPRRPDQMLGFGPAAGLDENGQPADANTYFQIAFEGLSREKSADKVRSKIEEIRQDIPEEDFPKFVDYLDTRSAMAERYRGVLGSEKGVEYRTPQEFRQMLGLEK